MKKIWTWLPISLALFATLLGAASDIPERPEELDFPDLTFEVPQAEDFRYVLDNGAILYFAEDRQFPLINVQVYFRGGQYLEPAGKEGLAQIFGETWRTGGAGDLSAQQLDERLEFLAARVGTGVGSTTGSVSLNLLSKDLEEGLDLLMEILLRPRFEDARFQKAKDDLLAAMQQRNDSTAGIEGREWNRLIYGNDYWLNRLATESSVKGLTREDLLEFHERLLHPQDVVVAVAGDVDEGRLLPLLNRTIGSIEGAAERVPEVPQPAAKPDPGVYLVDKPEVNQGRVSIGHLGLIRPVEKEFEITLANDVLGGSGFTSRIMSRVRSDEGLAYSAGSSFGINNTYPGTFRAFFQSKSAMCVRATELVLEIVDQLKMNGVTEDELETSQNSFVQTFPNRFQSKIQTVALFASDDLVGRSHDYWYDYRDQIRSVEQTAVREAADQYLRPDEFVILVVGNVDEILEGSPDHPDLRWEDFGPVTRLPLRDPMTLEPITP